MKMRGLQVKLVPAPARCYERMGMVKSTRKTLHIAAFVCAACLLFPDVPAAQAQASASELTVHEQSAFRESIMRCWAPPGAEAGKPGQVRLEFKLKPSGELDGEPRVLNSPDGKAAEALAQSAIRAVQRCAPYSLPVAKYESWRQIVINFVHQ